MTQIKTKLSQVALLRSMFMRSSSTWNRALPAEFMDMDLQFVLDNRTQFQSFKVLDEIVGTTSLLDRLGRSSDGVRQGGGLSLGFVRPLTALKEEREILLTQLNAFESRTHRRLTGPESRERDDQYPQGLENLSMAEGLEYLRAVGTFFFDVQEQLLECELSKMPSARSDWSVSPVRLQGLPELLLCSVCQGLLGKQRLVRDETPVPQQQHAVSPVVIRGRQPNGLRTG